MQIITKQGNKLEGIAYRFKIWRFYIWFTDYRYSNKSYMDKVFKVNSFGITGLFHWHTK